MDDKRKIGHPHSTYPFRPSHSIKATSSDQGTFPREGLFTLTLTLTLTLNLPLPPKSFHQSDKFRPGHLPQGRTFHTHSHTHTHTHSHTHSHTQLTYFKFSSNSLNIRLYSSVQLLGSLKPWSSTGYMANSQFSLPNSISLCASLTTS